MKKCAIIACDHGLGHLRRCGLLAKKKEKLGNKVTLLAPLSLVQHLQAVIPSLLNLNVYDFHTNTSPDCLRSGLSNSISWLTRLPNLDTYDEIICDNLPEILNYRTNATISAQFFWHDVIPDISIEYFEHCEKLLNRYKPKIIGCRYFTMSTIRSRPNFQDVDLYRIPELTYITKRQDISRHSGLLISGGSTPVLTKILTRYIKKILEKGPKEFQSIYVDPQLLPDSVPNWMKKADFTLNMYSKISHALCRPGLGTITDLLTVGALICPVYEINNREMISNHEALKRNFPESCFKIEDIYE